MQDSEESGPDDPKSGDVLGPSAPNQEVTAGDLHLALVNQYTERPDLLIEALERNDPGFVKKLNEKIEERAEKTSKRRFRFSTIQAYATLSVQVIAALCLLFLCGFAIYKLDSPFWPLIALGVVYAITQSGPSGFIEMCRGLADLLRSRKPDGD